MHKFGHLLVEVVTCALEVILVTHRIRVHLVKQAIDLLFKAQLCLLRVTFFPDQSLKLRVKLDLHRPGSEFCLGE